MLKHHMLHIPYCKFSTIIQRFFVFDFCRVHPRLCPTPRRIYRICVQTIVFQFTMSRAQINFKKLLKLRIQYLEAIYKIDDLIFNLFRISPALMIRTMVEKHQPRASSWSRLTYLQLRLSFSELVVIYTYQLFFRYGEPKPRHSRSMVPHEGSFSLATLQHQVLNRQKHEFVPWNDDN